MSAFGPAIAAIYINDDRTKLRIVLDDEETIVEFDAALDHGDQVGEVGPISEWDQVANYGLCDDLDGADA